MLFLVCVMYEMSRIPCYIICMYNVHVLRLNVNDFGNESYFCKRRRACV